MNIVIDSSVVINHTRAGAGSLGTLFNYAKKGKVQLLIPTIVVTELWAGQEIAGKEGQIKLEKLLIKFKQIDLTTAIAKCAGELIRKRLVSGFDAIIAATALELDAQLATSNKKHFAKVKGLKLF
ncbi:MAG: PIN domain-containing protein [bacterium]|nr:PIN domain-containing protein [bacterium]